MISKYFHTIRYLKPIQIYRRIWFKLYHPLPDLNPAPSIRKLSGKWISHINNPKSLVSENRFFFLNQSHEIKIPSDWNNPAFERLWLYNLHYFDDLNAEDSQTRTTWHERLMNRWIDENSPGHGTGWEPYPISLRVVNWIKWLLAGNSLSEKYLHSLAIQIRYLRKRLEFHILGNHLFANAKALIFGGLFFNGYEADKWLTKGLKILEREISEQILKDGGHFERSPMYHSIILEDVLDLINISEAYKDSLFSGHTFQTLHNIARNMAAWLNMMCHPDGQIVLFNDAAFGIAPSLDELRDYAGRLELEILPISDQDCIYLKETGYIRLQKGFVTLFIDSAPIGPDYLPGHAHADTLSFEWSFDKHRVIADSGTSCYGTGHERQRQRSTSAHNTITIDNQDSSEVWGGFRVARRAYPFGLNIIKTAKDITVVCSHNGYCRLEGQPVHHRQWVLRDHLLRITDTIRGQFKEAIGRFYFHPLVRVELSDSCREGILRLPNGQILRWTLSGAEGKIKQSTYHPEFGKSYENRCLEFLFTDNNVVTEFLWE